MPRQLSALFAALALLVAAGCSSDDKSPEASDERDAVPAGQDADSNGDNGNGDDHTQDDQPSSPSPDGVGRGTATVTLANGETFSFSTLCTLEPQIAAGSEILFTIASYDDPYHLDVNQFGEDAFGGEATISIYDSTTYDSVWDSSSMFGETELTLDGNTVTGSGTFFPNDDISGEGVEGELVATC